MKIGAFAPKEQMLHFPKYFQIHGISKASKGVIIELRVKAIKKSHTDGLDLQSVGRADCQASR